jgi:four helix bundle protein
VDEETFRRRTKAFALDTIKLVQSLPRTGTADVMGRQLLRSGTSIGANYRAACRAKSAADMLSKLKVVEEEGDESAYWLELLTESGILTNEATEPLRKEANELVAMTVASIKTLRARLSKSVPDDPQTHAKTTQSSVNNRKS